MTQVINTDLMLRMSTLNQEFHLLATNTNLFMRTIKDQLLQQQQDNQTSRQICDLNTQSVSELRWHLDQQVGNLYKKYEEQVNDKIREFESIQKQKEISEQNRIKELEQRFNQYDEIIKELDKKWESKSNDRYIASIIQKNLLTNQNIGQFIVDKVLKLTDEAVQNKINEFQKLIDERITNQFHQISNYQIQIRKCESKFEEIQNQLNIQKEFEMEFQKSQQKKLQVLSHHNSLFKEVIQQQVHNIIEQSELYKNDIKGLKEQVSKLLEQNSIIKNNESFMQIIIEEQHKISELEKKYDLIFQNENEIKSKLEYIQQVQSQQNQTALNQIITMDSEVKNINFAINGIYEKMNTITLNPQTTQEPKQLEKPQEKFKPLLISSKIQKQFSLRDQIGQIEILFRHVQLLFNHICKTYRYEYQMELQKQKQKSELTKNNSKEQVPSDIDHPQYVFQQYAQQQKQEQLQQLLKPEQLKVEQPSPQQQTLNTQNQIKINVQPIYQGHDDYFGDTRLYFNTALKPLYIQGKQHAYDIRPQIEMQQLSAKVKQMANLFCDSDLRQQIFENSQSCRPGSGKKRLPKINSKSFNLSNEDQ